MSNVDQIANLQRNIHQANHIVFLTGAEVSTAAGIPDFRSKNGIYRHLDQIPEFILNADMMYRYPPIFYDFMIKNILHPDTQPNVIHKKLLNYAMKKSNFGYSKCGWFW